MVPLFFMYNFWKNKYNIFLWTVALYLYNNLCFKKNYINLNYFIMRKFIFIFATLILVATFLNAQVDKVQSQSTLQKEEKPTSTVKPGVDISEVVISFESADKLIVDKVRKELTGIDGVVGVVFNDALNEATIQFEDSKVKTTDLFVTTMNKLNLKSKILKPAKKIAVDKTSIQYKTTPEKK